MIRYGATLLSFATAAASIALRQHGKLQYQHGNSGRRHGKEALPEPGKNFELSGHVINSVG